jgi:DNA-binding protein Fis
MSFMLIETKTAIQQHKHIIFDILSSNLSLGKVDDHPTFMFIDFEYADLNYDDLFINLAEELYSDLRVYVSQVNPRYEKDVILSWFQLIPFQGSVIYDDSKLLLKRMDYPIDNTLREILLKSVVNDTDLLDTVKVYLESNQNMSEAARKLYLHRNTLIQRLDKFYLRTGFDCRNFVDAYIIYTLLK